MVIKDLIIRRDAILILLVILCLGRLRSQNLVQDPSFESFLECPSHMGNFGANLKFWSVPTSGTTDYFNSCSSIMGVPNNFMGIRMPQSGKGYAGLYMYAPSDYREYIQGVLRFPLIKDTIYNLSFYVSLAGNSDYAVRDFEVLFSEKLIDIDIKKELSKLQLAKTQDNNYMIVKISRDNFILGEKSWVKLSGSFVAKGKEQFIIIGNFKSNATTPRKILTKQKKVKGAYYYVDMVYVGKENMRFNLDKTYIFENIYFDFDAVDLDEKGESEIELLFQYLNSSPTYQIIISGHTDNLGTPAYNKLLSEKRAMAVANRLVQLGFPSERIVSIGYGDTRPIVANADAEARTRNRRVEFVIAKNGDY